MAARKSCTHITWAEAKSKSGIASGVKKNKEFLRKQDHGQLQAQKIIAKHRGDEAENRKIQKAYRKLDEKSAALAAQREEEREQKRLAALQEVRLYDRAKQNCIEMMQDLRVSEEGIGFSHDIDHNSNEIDDQAAKTTICACRRMQLDEITALEALLPEDDFVISHSSLLPELCKKLEQVEADDDAIASVSEHPPVSFYIRLEVDDHRTSDDDDLELNANIIIKVTLPQLYLKDDGGPSECPMFDFVHIMVTDKKTFCSADKPLESLAWLDTTAIQEAMLQYAQDELLPYPCVYEAAVTWVSERVFDFLHLHSHVVSSR